MLLNLGVSRQSFGCKIGRNTAAQILVFLTHHVNEVVLAEKFFSERVADEVEGVGADVGEDFVRKVGGADEDDESSDYIVGGKSDPRGFGHG